MKALQLTKDSSDHSPSLTTTTVSRPTSTPGHLLVEIKASAINPSDRLNAKGGFGHTTIGQEVFGTSSAVLGFAINGPHAQYCLIPEDLAVAKPKNLSHVQAASVGVPFTTALLCLTRARTSKEDSVLVIGANGAVGSAAVQIARALGCRTVLTAARNDQADVDTRTDPELKKLKSLTQAKGVDVVIDTVGDFSLMQAAIDHLAARGRYTFIAAPRGGASTVLGLDILQVYRKQVELIGCNSVAMKLGEVNAALSVIKDWFENGTITPKTGNETEAVSLDDAEKAYRTVGHKSCVIVMESCNEVIRPKSMVGS